MKTFSIKKVIQQHKSVISQVRAYYKSKALIKKITKNLNKEALN